MRLAFITVFIILFPRSAWSHSVFSGYGMGEIVWGNSITRGRGGISGLYLPGFTAFELSFSSDFLRSSEGKHSRNDFAFNLPHTRYYMPMPNEFGIDLGLRNFLNMDFSIRSPEDTIAGKAYTRHISGKGGINIASLGVTKKIKDLSLKGGVSFLFGSFVETWKTDFAEDESKDVVDTLAMNFLGTGFTFALSYRFEELTLALSYALPVTVRGKNHNYSFPWRRELALSYRVNDRLQLLSAFWVSPWGDFKIDGELPEPRFLSSSKISLGLEYVGKSNTLRCGIYHMPWYYGGIEENMLTLGISVPFKDGEVSLSIELGRRSNPEITEDVVRLCTTFVGTEKW